VAASVNETTSYLEIEPIENPDGVEEYTPGIIVEQLEAGLNNWNKKFDRVKEAVFINLDKTGVDIASAPISNCNVNSKYVNYSYTYFLMLAERARNFVTSAANAARCQCFHLLSTPVSPSVDINLTLTSGNVNANKCFVVIFTGYQSNRLFRLADVRSRKMQAEQLIQAGAPVSTKAIAEINNNELAYQPK